MPIFFAQNWVVAKIPWPPSCGIDIFNFGMLKPPYSAKFDGYCGLSCQQHLINWQTPYSAVAPVVPTVGLINWK